MAKYGKTISAVIAAIVAVAGVLGVQVVVPSSCPAPDQPQAEAPE